MKRVRLFHWREAEADSLIELLRTAGFQVDYPGDKANGHWASLRAEPPYAAVIDLTRLPSHGRYVGLALRQQKSLRHIPIVFVDGDPAKVERIRGELPDAVFTSRAKLTAVLKNVKPVASPTVPPASLTSPDPSRSTAQKLGIKEGMRVAVIDATPGYAKVIGPLPKGASFEEDPDEILPLTLWFVTEVERYLAGLPALRRRQAFQAPKTRTWVIYPKGFTAKKGGLTQFVVREAALELGLVDYKICSLDAKWTGMLFTLKKLEA